MAETDRSGTASPWNEGLRAAMDSLSWMKVLQVSAGVAVLAIGLGMAGAATWAVMATQQTMHGRMATYIRAGHRAPVVHVGPIEVAENTP